MIIDDEQQLLFQEGLLVQELELVRNKLKYVRLVKSEQEKDNIIPSPAMEKIISSPECPAPGKDSSNPVMAMNLPKVQTEEQSSATLVKPSDFNLRPNGGIQIPKKSDSKETVAEKSVEEIQFPINSKPYYVVFNGPNAGIYESWDIAKKASDGVSGVRHKKYKSYLEAKTSAKIYCGEKQLPPLELITGANTLRPNNFAEALAQRPKTKVLLGKIPKKEPVDDGVYPIDIKVSDFEFLYSCARRATEEKFAEESYFTTDKKNVSYYNFCKNANPEQVFEAFSCGLVNTIYPSSNLLEISKFPKEFRKSVKNFRTKCVKNADKDIFLKVQSTIPRWNNGVQIYRPHHIIQIGISNGEKYFPSKKMPETIKVDDLPLLAIKSLERIIDRTLSFSREDKIFSNHQDDKIFMYSSSFKSMMEVTEKAIIAFQQIILTGHVLGSHNPSICQMIEKKTANYSCKRCHVTSIIEEKPPKIEDNETSGASSSSTTQS